MKRGAVILPGLAAALLAAGCLEGEKVASTEILNPPGSLAAGTIQDSGGVPAPGVVVRAFPLDYNPVSDARAQTVPGYLDTTDKDGAYCIKGMEPGYYNLVAVRPTDGFRLFIPVVKVLQRTAVSSLGQFLRAPGAIHFTLPDSLQDSGAYVYLPGSPFHATPVLAPSGVRTAFLDSVPAGRLPGVVYHATVRATPNVFLTQTTVAHPGDTLPPSGFSLWAHNRRIFVCAAAASLRPSGLVRNFPLLVTLESGNFDFSQARANGADLRFAKKDGTPLPYEIADWDPGRQRASLWVLLDTVRGDEGCRPIRMYWGNDNAADQSSGARVFRPANGYQGVWHLNETGNSDKAGYQDATGNANHGTGIGMPPGAQAEGPTGQGQYFPNAESYIHAGAAATLHAEAALTLEAWVKADTFLWNKNLMSRAFTVNDTPFYEYAMTLGTGSNFRFNLTVGGRNVEVYSPLGAVPGQWYHVAGSYDGSMVRMFVNGVQTDSLPQQGAIAGFNRPLLFGHYEHSYGLPPRLALDELRMSNVAHPSDYHKLSFENQRAGSLLLRFEPE